MTFNHQMKTKWTIGMVNYYSSVYIEWQIKILYNFNKEQDFTLIIVDNSDDQNEFEKLKKLSKDLSNVKLVEYKPKCKTASGQHGEGLDKIVQTADSEYIILQDPDFFWLKKDYLLWLEYLLKYNDAVGIPYPQLVTEGQGRFPGAFGCAFNYKKIRNLSFKAYIEDSIEISRKKYEEFLKTTNKPYDFSYDVGWKVRKALSKDNDYNFISFHQKDIFNAIGEHLNQTTKHSFETISKIYYHNNEPVSLHLFRGTFTGKVDDNLQDAKQPISNKLYNARHTITKFIYECISENDFSFTNKKQKPVIDLNINLLSKITFIKLLLKFKRTPLIKCFVPIKKKSLLNILNDFDKYLKS